MAFYKVRLQKAFTLRLVNLKIVLTLLPLQVCVRVRRPGRPGCVYLFESRRHAPATGLHDAVVAAHVLTHLPVLFPPLLSAGQQRRVTEERCNTVTGQSGSTGREGREERSVSSPASQQQDRRAEEEQRKTSRQQKVKAVVFTSLN